MADMTMSVTISKAALDLIRAGKAVFSSGGVRMLDGTLVELYKVAGPAAKGQAARVISKMVSQVLIDPQTAFSALPDGSRELALRFAQSLLNSTLKDPQKAAQMTGAFLKTAGAAAVNMSSLTGGLAAIPNLYMTYQNGQKLNQVLQAVASLKGIAWAGTAVSSANLALSAVSFAMLSNKIDGISKKLDTIAEEIKQEMHKIQMEEMVYKTQILIDNLMSTVHMLEGNADILNEKLRIESYLNEAKYMIQRWIKKFDGADTKESDAIFTLLFDLTAMYAAVLKEYGAQYYYLVGSYPGNYDSWMQAFSFIDSQEVRRKLKETLWVANPIAPTEKLAAAYDFTLNSIRLQAMDLKEYKEVVPFMPKEAHFDFDAFIKDKIEKGEVEVVEKAESEDPREEVLLQQNGYAAV